MQDYPHKNKSLTGTIASDLILELFDGQTDVPYKEIKEKVTELHLSRGGLPQTSETTMPVRHGLNRLRKQDKAKNTKLGFWSINRAGGEANIPKADEPIEDTLVIGEGKSMVYLYYFPTYRSYAELKGKDSYPCKIGRTDGSTEVRINSQVATALPEEPKIGLIIQTDNPVGVEKQIHDILDNAGLRKADAPGQEWFVTNPNQVKRFYELFQKSV